VFENRRPVHLTTVVPTAPIVDHSLAMLGPTEFRDLVSGRRGGGGASMLRGLLRIAEIPYAAAVRIRNRGYDRDASKVHRVNVPIISVGNLTLGGTGKTPLVKWLARRIQDTGARVTLLSRGYGAATGEQNDEARELAQALPNVPHVQNRDRVVGAQSAIDTYGPDVILLDDGFQHRRLGRDLDIVLLDALEPFGFGHVFPRGTLREPLSGLARANIVCLSRADAVPADTREHVRHQVAEIAPSAVWCELAHVPTHLVNTAGATETLDLVRGKPVAAFCAIGNPAGFRHTLATLGCDVVSLREFADHHVFSSAELETVTSAARDSSAEVVLCTQKDLVKSSHEKLGDLPLWAVNIEMRFLVGQQSLEEKLDQVIRKK
jgi:tetraacyldisaccharide 4'-kinase